MKKIYGGKFALLDILKACNTSKNDEAKVELGDNLSYYISGRDGLYDYLSILGRIILYIPNLLCEEVYEVINRIDNIQVRIYTIKEDMGIEQEMLERKFCGNEIILIQSNFGNNIKGDLDIIKKNGGNIVFDATHCALDLQAIKKYSTFSDILFISIRKSLPINDGGIVMGGRTISKEKTRTLNKDVLIVGILSLFMMIARSIELKIANGKGLNLLISNMIEKVMKKNFGSARSMSILSKTIIKKIDYAKANRITRRNRFILSGLLSTNKNLQLVVDPEMDTCTYLPIRYKGIESEQIREKLKDKNLMCIKHWPTYFVKGVAMNNICQNMLSIPCDWRYTEEDMYKIAYTINSTIR